MGIWRYRFGILAAAVVLAASWGDGRPSSTWAAPLEQAACTPWVTWDRAGSCIGVTTWVAGGVVAVQYASWANGSPTFINVGRNYPDPARFTVVIWGEDRWKFGMPEQLAGHNLCAYGQIGYYGSPQIIARNPSQLQICE